MRSHRWLRAALPALLTVSLAWPAWAAEPAPAPAAVKGIYLSAVTAADTARREAIIDLIDRTELNAVVVDVKDDAGRVTFEMIHPVATAAGAVKPYLGDAARFTRRLRSRGIYPIARVVTFKDPKVAAFMPQWAAEDVRGGLWKDSGGALWLDPYNKEAWAYAVEIARAAAAAGFQEIQFDYVRFPSDGDLSQIRYPAKDARTRRQVIADFLAYARKELEPLGVRVSADVFGLVTSFDNDMGIGQRLEEIAPNVDVLSPMLYPSHYQKGNLGVPDPNRQPYDIVLRSLQDARKRLGKAGLEARTGVRPWLQDFSMGHTYTAKEVGDEIRAVYDAGYQSWLLWNGANRYTEAALKPDTPPYVLLAGQVGPQVEVELNGRRLANPYGDVTPFATSHTGRTLIPLRVISEALGATVNWDDLTRTARVTWQGRQVDVPLGETRIAVNGEDLLTDQPGVLWQGRTMVPVRFVAEAFGAAVNWDGARQLVLITLEGAECRPGYCL